MAIGYNTTVAVGNGKAIRLRGLWKASIDDEDFSLVDIGVSGGRITPPETLREQLVMELETLEPMRVACGSCHKVKVLAPNYIEWLFPKERFVTYESSDTQWCRYFGIGKEQISEVLFVLPDAYVTRVDQHKVTFVSTYELYRVRENELTPVPLP